MFLGNPIYLHLLFSSHILLFISLLLLSLSFSLIPLSHFPPLLPPAFPSVGLEIKPCHLPTHCTLLCSLGCESAHYSNKYLRGVRGIRRATSKTPTHPQPFSVACSCWSPILFTWTGSNGLFFAAPITCSRATFSQVQVHTCSGLTVFFFLLFSITAYDTSFWQNRTSFANGLLSLNTE